jgi:hypothetical protein
MKCYEDETDFHHNLEVMRNTFSGCFMNSGKVYSVTNQRLYNLLGCDAVKSHRSLLTFGRDMSIFRAKE